MDRLARHSGCIFVSYRLRREIVAPRVHGGIFGMSNRRQFVRCGVALAAAGFAPRWSALAQSDAATPAAATPVVPTDISTLPLKTPGQLTIHADKPAYPP